MDLYILYFCFCYYYCCYHYYYYYYEFYVSFILLPDLLFGISGSTYNNLFKFNGTNENRGGHEDLVDYVEFAITIAYKEFNPVLVLFCCVLLFLFMLFLLLYWFFFCILLYVHYYFKNNCLIVASSRYRDRV